MKIALMASVSATALCMGAASAGPSMRPITFANDAVRQAIVGSKTVKLYSQMGIDTGVAVISSNFTDSSFAAYSSAGADDFAVPSGHKWRITEVDVTGAYFNGSAPAVSESVFIYQDKAGKKALPGRKLAECDNLQGSDSNGSFAILLPKACQRSLAGGSTYWVSVVALSAFTAGGAIWGWETTHRQHGIPAAWENPRDGFGTGCTIWGVMQDCTGDGGEGPDFMFALKGLDHITGTPAP